MFDLICCSQRRGGFSLEARARALAEQDRDQAIDVTVRIMSAELDDIQSTLGFSSLYAAVHVRNSKHQATWPADRTPTLWMCGDKPAWDHFCPRHSYVCQQDCPTGNGEHDTIAFQICQEQYGGFAAPVEVGRTAAMPMKEFLGSDQDSRREHVLPLTGTRGSITVQAIRSKELGRAPMLDRARVTPKLSPMGKKSGQALSPKPRRSRSAFEFDRRKPFHMEKATSPASSDSTTTADTPTRSPWRDFGDSLRRSQSSFAWSSDSDDEFDGHMPRASLPASIAKASSSDENTSPQDDEAHALAVLRFVKDKAKAKEKAAVPARGSRLARSGFRREKSHRSSV